MNNLNDLVFKMIKDNRRVTAGITDVYTLTFIPRTKNKGSYILRLSRRQDDANSDDKTLLYLKVSLVLAIQKINAYFIGNLRRTEPVTQNGRWYVKYRFNYLKARHCFGYPAQELKEIEKNNKEIIKSVNLPTEQGMPAKLL